MKVGDLVKRKRATCEDDKHLSLNVGVVVDWDGILARVKWTNFGIAKWIDPADVEVISESR